MFHTQVSTVALLQTPYIILNILSQEWELLTWIGTLCVEEETEMSLEGKITAYLQLKLILFSFLH